ncbi:glycine cleavage system aminomethyltransferase GcvT [Mumia sp. ZJ1417]|uniref:glycine cleavage system aminomethyltransferase GcvT n=1 Tax=Mumia sp. ZJ1417 TaxID=2708082 RepID=UPI001422B37F|nr:glycine cleavage system aminomethyltransferase GcvT [Mumia sp. ZJ1417]QMW67701.1 glycine cleavage system aminomethyltransferase GcvT [Mumia sp. ZJ1417]
MTLAQSPLHRRHLDLGAKLAEFGGWEMPLEYAGGGVLAEHKAVREAVGVFDVSHLGKVTVQGSGAVDYLDGCFTNALGRIGAGQAQYTLCCDDDGGVVDDLIVYRRADDDVLLIPNAANTAEVVRRLREGAPEGLTITDRHHDFAVLAVQGPHSDETLAAIGLPVSHDYMSYAEAELGGEAVTVCRTGYTGERGYELVVPAAAALAAWDAIMAAGEAYDIRACGLGARDTLRTEMGYPLHGQDLSRDISPVMGRVGWAVGWDKPQFWGRDTLLAQRAAGEVPLLRGLVAAGRGIARPGMAVAAGGAEIGRVTSGTFSPTLRKGVALALLDRRVAVGDEVTVDVRGRTETFVVTAPPFVESSTR